MKKTFGFFAIIWALFLALFNVIVFVTPNEAGGMTKFGGAFWVGYIFITIAFIGQLVCAFFAFKPSDKQKVFYNIPLVTISYAGLIVMLIAGTACNMRSIKLRKKPSTGQWFLNDIQCLSDIRVPASEDPWA